jgi:hypothetical protein
MLVFFNKSRLEFELDSSGHFEGSCTRQALQLPGVIRVAGEGEDLVVCREGSDGVEGGDTENEKAHEDGDG